MSDITKLPKWAQSRIRHLEGEVRSLSEKLAIATGRGESPIYYQDSGSWDKESRRYIPEHATVFFHMGPRNIIMVHVDNKGQLCVGGYNGSISVQPWASNSVMIIPGD